ncbi:HEPN domain-containing protein [Archaeoglobus neptunius]|uniref:HEPN domain-containing protein n=1 Tax=Archaeoglobus neptunius TaxID=2798580 RepID=UPI001926EC4F|nr:HEPN domain-containing protein [Archaeoglobus neptunius]
MREIDDLVKKAEKFLNTAEYALELGDCDSCVSRCYYAMFFMAEAVLLTKGLTASTHKGVIAMFGEHFIKTGIIEREFGKMLSEAHDKRIIGDYGVGFQITRDEAERTLRDAHKFFERLKSYLDSL